MTGHAGRWRRLPAIAAGLALVCIFVARSLGPSDACEYTQVRTMSYTTDILVNGRWILPRYLGVAPATKPPLFNWVATPFVRCLGFASDAAHRAPSVLAAIACWALLVATGRRIGPATTLGWIAALVFCANHAVYKLAWVARPDMLLTFWIGLGWVAATAQLLEPDAPGGGRRQVVLWASVAAALLTKGPPALLLPIYAAIAARLLAGRWSAVNRLGWSWGLPLCLVPALAWIIAAAIQDPAHVRDQLLINEVVGRVTGLGPEGAAGRGPMALVQDIGHMPAYFLSRFAPWSVPAAWGLVILFRERRTRATTEVGWMRGAGLFVVVTIIFFSLSAGKRADYIAPCLVPASLLAAYALLRWRVAVRGTALLRWRAAVPWLAHPVAIVSIAAVTLAAHVAISSLEIGRGRPGRGEAAAGLVARAATQIALDPAPVAYWETGFEPLQAWMGACTPEGWPPIHDRLRAGGPFYVVSGRRPVTPETFEDYFRDEIQRESYWPHGIVEIDRAVTRAGEPAFAHLYRVAP